MKTLFRSLLLLGLILIMSCRDTKKEEAEVNATLEQVEAVETEIDNLVEDVNSKEKELEDALKELDSL